MQENKSFSKMPSKTNTVNMWILSKLYFIASSIHEIIFSIHENISFQMKTGAVYQNTLRLSGLNCNEDSDAEDFTTAHFIGFSFLNDEWQTKDYEKLT